MRFQDYCAALLNYTRNSNLTYAICDFTCAICNFTYCICDFTYAICNFTYDMCDYVIQSLCQLLQLVASLSFLCTFALTVRSSASVNVDLCACLREWEFECHWTRISARTQDSQQLTDLVVGGPRSSMLSVQSDSTEQWNGLT